MKFKKLLSVFLLPAVIILGGCTVKTLAPKELKEETKVIDKDNIESANVILNFGVGDLEIKGDEASLMRGIFTYNIPEWQPEVGYNISNKAGNLRISQPNSKSITTGSNSINKWKLGFNNSVPIDINISVGVGDSNIDLSSLSLKGVKIAVGTGDMTLDMSGDYKNNIITDIKIGVGEATLYLPKNTGVRVTSKMGVGKIHADGFIKEGSSYKNANYGNGNYNIEVTVDSGVGDITIKEK